MKPHKLTVLLLLWGLIITCLSFPVLANDDIASLAANSATLVDYKVHVSDYGWLGNVSNGEVAGTTGENRKMEAIRIQAVLSKNSHLRYQSHVQDIGWQGWAIDGADSGTTGLNKRLEAIKIEITGSDSSVYDVYYRTHVSDVGWLDWAKNGESSGSEGMSKQMEAIQIVILAKGSEPPGSTLRPYVYPDMQPITSASTHVENVGWQDSPLLDTTLGTTGMSQRMEAIKLIYLDNGDSRIEYKSHLADIGWESDWHSNGEQSGTTGEARQMEAIKIRLTGQAAQLYDIYYQTHCAFVGWLDWACNGDPAGTTGAGYRLEALRIAIVPKGSEPPGPVDDCYREPIPLESFLGRIHGCWLDINRGDEPLKSYVSGISNSYMFVGMNHTYNGLEGYFEVENPGALGGKIHMVDYYTSQPHDFYVSFKDIPADHLILKTDDGSQRELVRGDTTNGVHYTFSGLKQYGQLVVFELKDAP